MFLALRVAAGAEQKRPATRRPKQHEVRRLPGREVAIQ